MRQLFKTISMATGQILVASAFAILATATAAADDRALATEAVNNIGFLVERTFM